MMLNVDSNVPKLPKLCVRLITSSILASLGIMVGLAPEISVRTNHADALVKLSLSNTAWAQQFTPEETENYARAGYEVELLRREVYQELKSLMNEPPPNIVCDRQSTIDSLKPEAKAIANRYCTQSRRIVQQNNLSINRFNELKTRYDSKDSFYERVQEILIKLQN
ncbi:MAG: DUF4168 domain-containing protein [Cyanobacteria bacterium J06555_3]